MQETFAIELLSRIAADPIGTAGVWGPIIVPVVALLLLAASKRYLGGWPDLWRFRRAVLPHVAKFGAGGYPALDDLVDADLAGQVPEKTALPLQDREFVGIVDAEPKDVRAWLRRKENWHANTLASIQYEVVDGDRVWEVGSYALRPEGFVGSWQYHVRLTPRDGGRKTALWAHHEKNAWRHPVAHYNAVGWDAERGVERVREEFADELIDSNH